MRIFVADDNAADVCLLRLGLQEAKLEVAWTHAADGEQAIQSLAAMHRFDDRPDAIVLDLFLPKYNGHEILAWLRTQKPLQNVPVIILTGSSSPADQAEAIARGAALYLCKPLHLEGWLSLSEEIAEFGRALSVEEQHAIAC